MSGMTCGFLGRTRLPEVPAITTGTPGDVTVTALRGTAAWAGSASLLIIYNYRFTAGTVVIATPLEPSGSALAAIRVAIGEDSPSGQAWIQRSSGFYANQKCHWIAVPYGILL